MGYTINETQVGFQVVEAGHKPLLLDTWDTKEEAERSVEKWKARDNLSGAIAEFLDDMVQEYEGILGDEVKQMLKEADWS